MNTYEGYDNTTKSSNDRINLNNHHKNTLKTAEDFIQNSEYHYVSFAFFDDLNQVDGETRKYSNPAQLKKILVDFCRTIKTECSRHFDDNADDILDYLISAKYCVANRFEKYYVIAFAIDFEPFKIWSKDCEAETIKWIPIDEQSSLLINYNLNNNNIMQAPKDYDVSPVIKMIEALNQNK